MNQAIEALQKTRAFALQLASGLTDAELNTIPEGFNNNIIWNLAHLVAAEQGVCYIRGGTQPRMPMEYIKAYTRGSKPEEPISADEIAAIKASLSATPFTLAQDLEAGAFTAYSAWTTPYGLELKTIEDALQFLLFHEGLHCGYIMAMKRVLANRPT